MMMIIIIIRIIVTTKDNDTTITRALGVANESSVKTPSRFGSIAKHHPTRAARNVGSRGMLCVQEATHILAMATKNASSN